MKIAPGIRDGRSEHDLGERDASVGRERRVHRARSHVAHRQPPVECEHPVGDDGRHPRPASVQDRRVAHQARTVASSRSGWTAARMTSAMPPTPVQRSNAAAAWAMSISEPFAARSPRARAAASSGVSAGT